MVSLSCTFANHHDDVNWCAFSNDFFASCSLDKTIRIYSVKGFSELPFSPLRGHAYAVHSCCFDSSGKFLASCSTDGTTLLWSLETGEKVAVLALPGRNPVRICTFSPDSSYLVSGSADGTVALWDMHSRKLCRKASIKEGSVSACSFASCGQMFVTGSTYGDLVAWDYQMKILYTVKTAHDLGVTCCHFSAQMCSNSGMENNFSDLRLASCGQDSTVKIWIVSQDKQSGCKFQLLHILNNQSAPVLSCAFSSDGEWLVSGSVDKTVVIYDVVNGITLHTLIHHDRHVTTCAFSPNLPLLATGSMDKTVKIWKINNGKSSDADLLVSSYLDRKLLGRSKSCFKQWTEDEVCAWLCEEGLDEVIGTFKANNIDGEALLNLNREHLAMDLKIESLGLRNKVNQKIDALRMTLDSYLTEIPEEFLCPITQEIMKDPVIASDGYSYERTAIESWINTKKHSSPMTNLQLKSTCMTPNRTLKMAINRWLQSQSLCTPSDASKLS
ncbi:WD repeat, SAM and U-box domain-containing protein 1 [Erpetoichthys calabaricus]|uniref:WD repeat, SAM and U-box domain-containing protein 1 n=1 Tax=Erpetoichthys calabaricus TaxID=27687 RepID=UPI0010A0A9CD|nr:WD repeat, SAM and U-box domain-containing protein 1 [Erpetoichthys calabaricus]